MAWQEQFSCQTKKFFMRIRHVHNAPPPRGDFIWEPGLVKLFFRTKAKRRRAPKCPPLWRLRLTCHRQASYAAHREGFECTFCFHGAYEVAFLIGLDANHFRLKKLAWFALTRAVFAFLEEAHALDGGTEGELGEDCFHALKISKRRWIATPFSCFYHFFSGAMAVTCQQQKACQQRKKFSCVNGICA